MRNRLKKRKKNLLWVKYCFQAKLFLSTNWGQHLDLNIITRLSVEIIIVLSPVSIFLFVKFLLSFWFCHSHKKDKYLNIKLWLKIYTVWNIFFLLIFVQQLKTTYSQRGKSDARGRADTLWRWWYDPVESELFVCEMCDFWVTCAS